jgi:hypothetical protein
VYNDSIYSTIVRAGRITYLIDVREGKDGTKYVSISEHRIDEGTKKDRRVIRIFGESCLPFSQAVVT